jgi:alkanesulfonate monooxygenase SsuD/methylene tetrahydromethanopterin reductase-like flavin-dependent oxidoreductase (luciferase family)
MAAETTMPTYEGRGGLRFGVFDWFDDSRGPLAESLETRLRMLEYADQAGFFAYHVAEHHGTPLSRMPSSNLLFMALAQRTRRLRFGPMVYILPMYHPIRLIEEICLLDQISGGRLELGVGRAASPYEAEIYGVNVEESRAVAHEVLAIVTQGLATGEVHHTGQYFQFEDVKLQLRPVQRPYPPLWWPTVHLESVPWIAEHNFSILLAFLFASPADTGEHLRRYQALLRAHAGQPGRINGHVAAPHHGFAITIHVADTDDEARRAAHEAHAVFHANFSYLWVQHGDAARHAARADFDTFVNQGMMVCGSPDTVRARLQEYLDLTNANYLAGAFAFGNLREEQILRSLHLFREQVMPRLEARPWTPPA